MRPVRATLEPEQAMVAPGIPAGTRSYALYGGTEAASALATGQLLRTGDDDDSDSDIPAHDRAHDGLHFRSFMADLRRKLALRQVMGQRKGKSSQREQISSPDEDLPVYMTPRDQFAKEDVNYRYSGKPDHMCGACRYFIQPGACELVAGLIRPVDVCDKFELRPEGPEVPAVRANLAEQQGFFDNGGDFLDDQECPDEDKDAEGRCPDDPEYDEFTRGEYQRGDDDFLFGEATPAFPGSGGMNREERMGREGRVVHFQPGTQEVSPPGWGGTVKAMKKYMKGGAVTAIAEAMLADLAEQKKQKRVINPWALAWWMKKRGYTPHKPDEAEARESQRIPTVRATLA